jgi:Uma2 family endonuclease
MAVTAPIAPTTDLRPLTADDYRAMPDDGKRYELIFGELIMAPAPREKHQLVSMRLSAKLHDFVTSRELGLVYAAPFDVYLTNHLIVQPDILFVSREHMERRVEEGLHGPPDLIMAILSPSNRRDDLVSKAAIYADHGVAEYWVVDPDAETIVVNRLDAGRYVVHPNESGKASSLVLPGFSVEVASLFALPAWMTEKQPTAGDAGSPA